MINGKSEASTPKHNFKPAVYYKQAIRIYRGNKFIEALPPLRSEEDLVNGMLRDPGVLPADRALSSFERNHLIRAIPNSFMQPLTDHVTLATEVSGMIRAGYLTRDPSSPRFLAQVGAALLTERDESQLPSEVSGYGMAVIGVSGTGKSTAIEAVLRGYPAVIYHPNLSGPLRSTFQVTFIKITCPIDASPITVCRSFFSELDCKLGTNYHFLNTGSRSTLESMRDEMKRLCFIHGVGVLVIDEIQNLSRAKSGGAHALLKFFLTLRDVLKVPLIVIGTEEAMPVLGNSMQLARRHAGRPLFNRMEDGVEFELFCDALFSAWYLQKPLEDPKTFRKSIYYFSQGIADIAIKMFVLAQSRALLEGREFISLDMLQTVYDELLYLLHEHLDVLREGGSFHGPEYERSLSEFRKQAPCLSKAAINAATFDDARGKSHPQNSGLKIKRQHSQSSLSNDPTVALLPKIAHERNQGTTVYDALKTAGYIRDLEADVVSF